MIPKKLSDTSEGDLTALITNGVAEGRTIDYKRDLPGNADSDKKEFLAERIVFRQHRWRRLSFRHGGRSGSADFDHRGQYPYNRQAF